MNNFNLYFPHLKDEKISKDIKGQILEAVDKLPLLTGPDGPVRTEMRRRQLAKVLQEFGF